MPRNVLLSQGQSDAFDTSASGSQNDRLGTTVQVYRKAPSCGSVGVARRSGFGGVASAAGEAKQRHR